MSISHDVNKGNIHVWHAYLSFYVGKLESTDCHQFLFRNLRGKLHFLYLCIYALTTLFFFFYTKSNLRRSKTQEAPCLNINITSYKQMRKITVPAYVWNKHLYIQLVNIYHYLHLILVFLDWSLNASMLLKVKTYILPWALPTDLAAFKTWYVFFKFAFYKMIYLNHYKQHYLF